MATATLQKTEMSSIESLIVGNSPQIVALRKMIERIAHSDASVLITGPSGSGKEMVARAIHVASQRDAKPFVALNCGAIPGELIESELFGHEKGSFTGAQARRIGRFEESDKGTLFLDEIGDMRFDMQVKLLRVLEDGRITRVGGSATFPVDVRIIAATHQDIDRAIADNRFREDLYFRLGVIPLNVPDLASRTEDLPLLIEHFQKDKKQGGRARFDASAMTRLKQHRWPGNVRELRNFVERAAILHGGEMLSAADVDQLLGYKPSSMMSARALRETMEERTAELMSVAVPASNPAPRVSNIPAAFDRTPVDLKALLEEVELERIQMALEMANGVIPEAARLLTLKRTTLIEKMRKYGVTKDC